MSQPASQPAVVSVTGGVGGSGATTVLGSLGRAFSIIGERVLIVDAAGPSTLDYIFNASDVNSGLLRSTTASSTFEGQLHVLRTDPEAAGLGQSWIIRFHRAIAELRGRLDRIVVSSDYTSQSPLISGTEVSWLVVLTPELRSLIAAANLVDAYNQQAREGTRAGVPWFVLNRFSRENSLHQKMRDRLSDLLGPQLLPVVIPESSTVDASLAEGVSPVDLAPQSEFAEACFDLVDWCRKIPAGFDAASSYLKETQLVSE